MRTAKTTQFIGISLFAFFALSLIHFAPVLAATLYVDDMLVVSLREGPGTEYKAIKVLKTGMALMVLEDGDRYVKVRTQDGKEGFVLKQYVNATIPKADIIARLEKEVDRSKKKVEELEKSLTQQKEDLKSTVSDHSEKAKKLQDEVKIYNEESTRSSQDLRRIKEQYENLAVQSKRTVELVSENTKLKSDNTRLEKQSKTLGEENTRLSKNLYIRWFLSGGGVFFLGFLAGRSTPRRKRFYD